MCRPTLTSSVKLGRVHAVVVVDVGVAVVVVDVGVVVHVVILVIVVIPVMVVVVVVVVVAVAVVVVVIRDLTQKHDATATRTSPSKILMNKTMAVHVHYDAWYSSLPSSAKQQRQKTKFCVFWRT